MGITEIARAIGAFLSEFFGEMLKKIWGTEEPQKYENIKLPVETPKVDEDATLSELIGLRDELRAAESRPTSSPRTDDHESGSAGPDNEKRDGGDAGEGAERPG